MNHTRRSLLAGAAAAGVASAAGCLGGSELDLDTGEYGCDLDEPASPDLDYRPVLGDPNADVVVQAFEDFGCPACATYKLNAYPVIRDEYVATDEIRYEHWDFPIPADPTWTVPIASAARGVGAREGNEAFETFASTIYESEGAYDGAAIAEAAEAAGADPCLALADAQFSAYEEASMNDKEEGETMGVGGTPSIFVNGSLVDGTSASAVMAAIDDVL